jgi:hypothetical protein
MDGRKGLARRKKRERRKKQKEQRWLHGQLLGSLPSLRIECDEGVDLEIIQHAKGLRRWYHGLGLIGCCGNRQREEIDSLMAWRQGDDRIEARVMIEVLRGQLHSRLAEECSRRGIQYGVISRINTADRAIEIRVCSYTWRSGRNGGRIYLPRYNPEPRIAYTEHFLKRWLERVTGLGKQQRTYVGYWDLLGALHAPGRAFVMEDTDGDGKMVRIVASVLGASLPVGYAVVRDYHPPGGDRYALMITLLTEAMVEAPWTMDDPLWERLYHQFPLPDPASKGGPEDFTQEECGFFLGWQSVTEIKSMDVTESVRVGRAIWAASKQCYFNARAVVQRLDDYADASYVEGIACLDGGPPVEHAWVCRPDGTLIDPTVPRDGGVYFPALEFGGRAGIEEFLATPRGSGFEKRPFFFAFGRGGRKSPAINRAWEQGWAYHRERRPAAFASGV